MDVEEALTAAQRREELERAIWRLTEWRGTADVVDELLRGVDEYAAAVCEQRHGPVLGLPPAAGALVAVSEAVKLVDTGKRTFEAGYTQNGDRVQLVEISLIDANRFLDPITGVEPVKSGEGLSIWPPDRDDAPVTTIEETTPEGGVVTRAANGVTIIDGPQPRTRTWILKTGVSITRTWGEEKVCRGCELTRPIDDYNFDRSTGDGHSSRCRTCANYRAPRGD